MQVPFKDLRPWLRVARWASGPFVFFTVFSATLHLADVIRALSVGAERPPTARPDAVPRDELARMAASASYLMAYILSTVALLGFQVRAARNLKAPDRPKPRYRPWLRVASFVVPVVNLVVPYPALREIVTAASASAAPGRRSTLRLLRVWWLLWVGSAAMGCLLLRNSQAATAEGSVVAVGTRLASDLVNLGLTLASLRLLHTIFQQQLPLRARRGDAGATLTASIG